MAFWKRADTQELPRPLATTSVSATASALADDAALEELGALLRRLGESGDADDERQRLEAWAHHVLLQGPVPDKGRLPPGRRDWRGMRAYVDDVLRARSTRNGKAIGDLRDTVGAMTRTLVRALSEDKATDDKARLELGHLKMVAEQRPPEEVKRCALAVVESLSTLMNEREERHLARLRELDDKARGLEGRLVEAQREKHEDALTGLVNRRGLDQELERALEARHHHGDTSSVILFDLDHFKSVNDTWGHVGGDLALKAFSRTLSLCFPRKDDCVARYGGEEFMVVLRGAHASDAMRLAERCLQRMRAMSIDVGGGSIVVTASAGVAEVRRDDDAHSFVARADASLYRAKRAGRDRACGDAGGV